MLWWLNWKREESLYIDALNIHNVMSLMLTVSRYVYYSIIIIIIIHTQGNSMYFTEGMSEKVKEHNKLFQII